jgi:hypothetical protein
MPVDALRDELASGIVCSSGVEEEGDVRVMGIQSVQDTMLIRYSYVQTTHARGAWYGSTTIDKP